MSQRALGLNREVAMVTAGMSKFDAFSEKTRRKLFFDAFTAIAKPEEGMNSYFAFKAK